MQKWGQVGRFQVGAEGARQKTVFTSVATASDVQVFSQLQQGIVWRGGQEATDRCQVCGSCKADKQALRPLAQEAVQGHAHGQVAGTANTARRDARNPQAGDGSERRAGVGQAFQDQCGRLRGIERVCDGRLALLRGGAGDQCGKRHPFFASLLGSTPNCLSLR